jgi:hypothetical protein
MTDKIVDKVVNKYKERSVLGQVKYGTTLQQRNNDNYLKHLQEELMDATLYIQKLTDLKKDVRELALIYPNDAELGKQVRKLIFQI